MPSARQRERLVREKEALRARIAAHDEELCDECEGVVCMVCGYCHTCVEGGEPVPVNDDYGDDDGYDYDDCDD